MDPHAHHIARITEGFCGAAAPVLGVIASCQEQLEFWLRIASLVIGIAVGLATLYRILVKRPSGQKE